MQTVDRAEAETVEARDGVFLTQLAAGERMSVQHYHFAAGANVPAHAHDHEQVGIVTRGALTFTVPDADDGPAEYVVAAGETYAVPGGEVHACENEGDVPAEGVDVFSPPRREARPWESD
ncbi:MAG: cupin domain-containing protein [Halobacteriaceae archaeon]